MTKDPELATVKTLLRLLSKHDLEAQGRILNFVTDRVRERRQH